MQLSIPDPAGIVKHLRELQRLIRQAVISSRNSASNASVSRSTSADTIYGIDAVIEPVIEDYLEHWAKAAHPIVLIAEGIEPETGRVFPHGAKEADAPVRLIIDPIDGTRGLMYDKRAAWSLAGAAPNKGNQTRLRDIQVAVMTELPTSKMGYSDVLWATAGQGAQGVRETLLPLFTPLTPTLIPPPTPLKIHPSAATDILHGFATVASFFPGTKQLSADLMEHIVSSLIGKADVMKATIFDDQYICTGGQFYELIVGHDRFIADLRPYFYAINGQPEGLCCHPYDCATMLIAEEAGVPITNALGQPLDGPLDCVTGLSWAGFANAALRSKIEPLIRQFMASRGLPAAKQ